MLVDSNRVKNQAGVKLGNQAAKLGSAEILEQPQHNEKQKTIHETANKSFSGLDDIGNTLVKISSEVTVPYLTNLIDLSFIKGKFPKALAKAEVIPLHKDGDKSNENNYRPKSLIIT